MAKSFSVSGPVRHKKLQKR